MKKILTVALSLLLLAALAVPALATETAQMTISASQNSAKPGESITFTVKISAVDDCRSAGIVISYDTSVFEYVSGKCLASGAAMSDFSGGTGVLAFSEGATLSGNIFQFTLKVKSSAAASSYQVSGSPSVRTGEGEISCGISSAYVSVTCDHTYGNWNESANGHSRTCSKCGYVDSASHAWNSGTVIKAATCAEEGSKRVTCTVCGATATQTISKTDDHTWGSCEKRDGGTHKQTCTVCGKQNTANHTWNTGKTIKESTCQDSGEVRYTCTGCGASKTETIPATKEHTYDHDCDSDCNVCGAIRETSHTYEDGWSADESSHWHVCTVCGEQNTVIAHEYESDCATVCLTCGYVRSTAHAYGDWHNDETGHWQECTLCGVASEVQSHIPGPEATENTSQVCMICAQVLNPALDHSFDENWQSDEENHWHECVCGAKTDEAAHTWDTGRENKDRSVTYTCSVCAAQRTEEATGLSPAVQTALIALATALAGMAVGYFIPRKKG